MKPDVPPAREVSTLIDRLAWKLGCDTVVLVGCVSREFVAGVTTSQLACFDREDRTSYASALRPLVQAGPLASAARVAEELGSALPVIAASALDALGDDLQVIRAAAPAVVIVGDGDAGHAGLGALVARLRLSGAIVQSGLLAAEGSSTHRREYPVVVMGGDGVSALLNTGLQSLRLDPAHDTLALSGERARVCIVSYEVVGPVKNGGIGTANTSLALRLAEAGHDVTLLFTATPSPAGERDRWKAHFESRNVLYDELDAEEVDRVRSPHINVRRAWAAFEWVRRRHEREPFDVIHAPECQGHGAFIALAKRHGVAFATSEIVIGVHSTTRWCAEANRDPLTTLDSVTDDHLERVSVESADVVLSPSAYMISYLRSRGWRLPRRCFVQQYTRSEAVLAAAAPEIADGERPSELVFYGRLETRKGLALFCAALDLLAAAGEADGISVTFLGSAVMVAGEPSRSYIDRRAGRWPWPIRIETEYSQPEAVNYLRSRPCVAVMPSLVDNSPNTVYEALGLGIPFVAARTGGTGELVALDDLERSTFEATSGTDVVLPVPADEPPPLHDAAELAGVLSRVLTHPASAVRPAVDAGLNEAVHVAWHSAAARESAHRRRGEVAGVGPLVSVLTDEPTNAAFRTAAGEVVVVVPDAVTPSEHLSTVVGRAATRSRADILLLVMEDAGTERCSIRVPVAGPAVLALSYPYFGRFFAIRVDAFRRLGGLDETLSASERAADLLRRAAIAGLHMEVVPAVLGSRNTQPDEHGVADFDFWLEASPWSGEGELQLARLRPFVQSVGSKALTDLPGLLRGGQELLARFRVDHQDLAARWDALYQETVAYGQDRKTAYDDLKAHTDRLQQAYEDQLARAQSLEQSLSDLHGSTSWRMTAPMRRIRDVSMRRRGPQ